eukprot:scaffold218341_cov31-Tisochrysis_lutea.AAC.1
MMLFASVFAAIFTARASRLGTGPQPNLVSTQARRLSCSFAVCVTAGLVLGSKPPALQAFDWPLGAGAHSLLATRQPSTSSWRASPHDTSGIPARPAQQRARSYSMRRPAAGHVVGAGWPHGEV